MRDPLARFSDDPTSRAFGWGAIVGAAVGILGYLVMVVTDIASGSASGSAMGIGETLAGVGLFLLLLIPVSLVGAFVGLTLVFIGGLVVIPIVQAARWLRDRRNHRRRARLREDLDHLADD